MAAAAAGELLRLIVPPVLARLGDANYPTIARRTRLRGRAQTRHKGGTDRAAREGTVHVQNGEREDILYEAGWLMKELHEEKECGVSIA